MAARSAPPRRRAAAAQRRVSMAPLVITLGLLLILAGAARGNGVMFGLGVLGIVWASVLGVWRR